MPVKITTCRCRSVLPVGLFAAFALFTMVVSATAGPGPAASHDAKPLTAAQYQVRHAAMLAMTRVADYDVTRSAIPEEKKGKLLAASAKLAKDLKSLIDDADAGRINADVAVTKIVQTRKVAAEAVAKLVGRDDEAELMKTARRVNYESSFLWKPEFAKPKGPDRIGAPLAAAGTTAEQRDAIANILMASNKRHAAEMDRYIDESQGLSESGPSHWAAEQDAAMRPFIDQVRAVLSAEQLAKWDRSIDDAVAKRDKK